jgi:hypothetical protein
METVDRGGGAAAAHHGNRVERAKCARGAGFPASETLAAPHGPVATLSPPVVARAAGRPPAPLASRANPARARTAPGAQRTPWSLLPWLPVVGGREQRRPSPTRAPGAPSPDATMRETAEAAAAGNHLPRHATPGA